jgi:hypothetical protein
MGSRSMMAAHRQRLPCGSLQRRSHYSYGSYDALGIKENATHSLITIKKKPRPTGLRAGLRWAIAYLSLGSIQTVSSAWFR